MSTKIYDGMIAVDDNVFAVQRKIKEVIEPMFYDQFFAALDMVRESPDKTWLELFQIFGSSRYAAWDTKIGDETEYQLDFRLYDLIEALQKDPEHTFSSLDFGYEVVLLPNGARPRRGAAGATLLGARRQRIQVCTDRGRRASRVRLLG